MLLAKRERNLTVGAQQALLSGDFRSSDPALAVSCSGHSLTDLVVAIREACKDKHRPEARVGGKLRVAISDRWLVWTTIPWTDELLHSGLEQHALHVQIATGREPTEFSYASQLGEYGSPTRVVALPQELQKALVELANAYGLEIVSVRPLSLLCWERRRSLIKNPQYAYASVGQGSIVILFVERGQPIHIVAQRYQPGESLSLSVIWRRVRLREPALADFGTLYADCDPAESVEPGDDASVLILTPPAQELAGEAIFPDNNCREFDFVAKSAPTRSWRMALAVVGLTCLAMSGFATLAELRRKADVDSQLQTLQGLPAPRPARFVGDSRQRRTQIHAVNQAVRSLNAPVGTLLQAVQPPRELSVALLALDLSDPRDVSGTGLVKLSAESRTIADMTGYVEFLSQAGPFANVYLVRHEVTTSGSQRAYRFSIEALWPQ